MYVHHHFYQHYELLQRYERSLQLKQAIFATVKPGDKVLDAGCGSGILSVWAAQAGARVVAVDFVDLDLARTLAADNGESENIEFIEDDLLAFADSTSEKFDVMLAMLYINDPRRDIGQQQLSVNLRSKLLKPEGKQIPDKVQYKAFLVESRDLDIVAKQNKLNNSIHTMEGYYDLNLQSLYKTINHAAPPAVWFPARQRGSLLVGEDIRILCNDVLFATIDYASSSLDYPSKFEFIIEQAGTAHAVIFAQQLYHQGKLLFTNESISWIAAPRQINPDDHFTIDIDENWRRTNRLESR